MYTYRITTQINPDTIARTFIYDVKSKEAAKRVFFKTQLKTLRKAGLVGSALELRKNLPLTVERVGKTTLTTR
jgi:hypothetical protein